jgi:hypothetical protein
MDIRVIDDNVRLRSTPEFKDDNIVRLLARGTIFKDATLTGSWWQVSEGYIHASMIEPVDLTIVPIPSADVPYRSQWDGDANNRRADCGQTCVAMLATWKGVQVRINDLVYQSQSNGISGAGDLVRNFEDVCRLAAMEVSSPVVTFPPLPAICLVWYGGFLRSSVQDKAYKGWHWLVLLDVHDRLVVTHDPDFWGNRRNEGNCKQYSMQEWQAAFIPYGSGQVTTAVVLM